MLRYGNNIEDKAVGSCIRICTQFRYFKMKAVQLSALAVLTTVSLCTAKVYQGEFAALIADDSSQVAVSIYNEPKQTLISFGYDNN